MKAEIQLKLKIHELIQKLNKSSKVQELIQKLNKITF